MCGSLDKEQCNTCFTGQGTVQYFFDNVVSYVVSKTTDSGVYLMIDTIRQVRILHHQRNHSHTTGVGSKHTPSTVTIIASPTSKKLVLGLTHNNVQLVDVNVETLLAQK